LIDTMKDTLRRQKSVYGRLTATRAIALVMLIAGSCANATPAMAQSGNDATVLDARDALRKRDTGRLSQLRATAINAQHPLAMWVDYWDLTSRLNTVQAPEVEAFYARWPNTYVEDRLRNDWLLELGRRRDWKTLSADFQRFRMNDDRQVTCYSLLADHLDGKDVRAAARAAWFAQRDADDGCALMASTLYEAKVLTEADAWRRARVAIDANRPQVARQAALLVRPQSDAELTAILDNPAKYLAGKHITLTRAAKEFRTLALLRLASSDPDAAAIQLNMKWEAVLPPELTAWAWAAIGKQAAMKLQPDASTYYQRADVLLAKAKTDIDWTDEILAWKARAALRANDGKPRWQQAMQAIDAMSASEQKEATWVYWKARALQALSKDSAEGEAMAAQSREMLGSIANQLSFYGSLAAEDLGQPIALPARPEPPSPAERVAALRDAGLTRATQLLTLGLRSEGVREWNYSVRALGERELLAAAQLACDRGVWDRCVFTSEKTRTEIDLLQRYPTPFRSEIIAASRAAQLDPGLVFGLIRQESRFQADVRSPAAAYGLMQVIQPTAKVVARRIGMGYDPAQLTDVNLNLKLGTSYLKMLLNDFDNSQAMSAAGYNAGPGRPRRWREGAVIDTAIWIENIPFSETRDYVKKVLSNATFYSALLRGADTPQAESLKARMGRTIGPRPPQEPPPDVQLP
jgi:soluble lytic murein transglycosylase